MPTYTIQTPDGRKLKIEADNEQAALRGAREWSTSNGKTKRTAVDNITGFMANVNRGLGIGDELAAGASALAQTVSERPSLGQIPNALASNFREGMARQRQIEDSYAQEAPKSAALARGVGMAGLAVAPTAPMAASSNALMAGVRGATSAATGAAGYGLADRGTVEERVSAANRAIGPAAIVGGALGAGSFALANRRPTPKRGKTETDVAADVLRKRAKANPEEMRARADRMRQAGVEPTGLDVIGGRGERLVRATGVKTDTAGETLTENAMRARADLKPAVMSQTRGLVDDPRTATQLADDLTVARGEAARTNYAAPYATPVQIDANTANVLRGEAGRAAIQRARQAAAARQDYSQMQELDSLLASNMDGFPTVSAGTLDRIRIAMGERAQTASRRGANDLAAGYRMREAGLNRALDEVDGLQPARADYRNKTQAIEVLGRDRKDVFSTDPRDYRSWLQSLSPEARQANAVAIRQEVLDTLGGQRQSSFGTLDDISQSTYARENLRAAIGEQRADDFLAGITERVAQTRRAMEVTPGAGSRTAVLENDLQGVTNALTAADVAQKGLRGDLIGVVRTAADWFRRAGVSDEQANALAVVVTDPRRLDGLIDSIERQGGAQQAQAFMQRVQRATANSNDPVAQEVSRVISARLSRGAALATQAPRPAVSVEVEGRPDLGVGYSY